MTPTIPLGFAVPSGNPVAIPVGHMAVVGQTQLAGKTTTLEACAARVPNDYAVLAFVTKRGESGFTNGVLPVQPYFRERADWEYVSSILEATLRERMKFERSWIMRACKGATSLIDVHRNVQRLMATAKGLSADIYYQLDHYLQKIIPQVKLLGTPQPLSLATTSAANVMDLSPFSTEMQGLVIASCLEYAYRHLHKTIIVIPEAWEFLPRQRKSPVTYAAEMYIRKGGALGNYLWIDSQDLSGVHTPVLKQVQIWLLGVQREINEVKRTLAHIHGVKKPKVDAVAGLGLGQFIACFGQQAVTTYVQPVWMEAAVAQQVAHGQHDAAYATWATNRRRSQQEDPVDEKLKAENNQLRQENADLRRRIDLLEKAATEYLQNRPVRFEELPRFEMPPPATPVYGLPENWLQQVREKILQDAVVQAALVKITATRPEILIEIEPRVFPFDGASAKGRLARMIANGLFDQPAKPGVAIKEFTRTGGAIHPSRLSEYLSEFVSLGFLLREGDTYVKAPGLKVTTKELIAV